MSANLKHLTTNLPPAQPVGSSGINVLCTFLDAINHSGCTLSHLPSAGFISRLPGHAPMPRGGLALEQLQQTFGCSEKQIVTILSGSTWPREPMGHKHKWQLLLWSCSSAFGRQGDHKASHKGKGVPGVGYRAGLTQQHEGLLRDTAPRWLWLDSGWKPCFRGIIFCSAE